MSERRLYSCTCLAVPGNDHSRIDPDCNYHKQAAKYPFDHSIPWNCPTYWDGCNCKRTVAALRILRSEVEHTADLAEEDGSKVTASKLRAHLLQFAEAN